MKYCKKLCFIILVIVVSNYLSCDGIRPEDFTHSGQIGPPAPATS
jgi:hypothetical protein